jgi:mono/diheme cytochrome c family protein
VGNLYVRVLSATVLTFMPSSATLAQEPASAEAGEQLYEQHCVTCHGEKLRATGAGADLRRLGADQRDKFDQTVLNGRGQMPAWQGVLADAELDALWAYVRSRSR